ncbi:MAG: hypothetical protein J0I87_06220, partial [Cellulomonas sp.]|nr:hypothetical protein [Cellulomonas sp.]
MSRPVRRAPARATPVVLLAVLLIASTWVFGGAPAVAASGSPSPSASALDTDLPVSVSIQRVMPTVLRPGDDLTVSVTLRNTGSAGIADPTVALRINRLRPTTRAELSSWIDRSSGVVGVRLTTVHPGALAPGAQLNVDLTVPASAIGLNNVSSGWGPRGLSVDVTDDGGDRAGTARTFALWLPDGTVPQARVSVLLPLTGPARTPTVAGGANAGATPGATGASTSGATAGATPQPSPSGTASTPSSVAVAPSAAEQAALERLTTAGGRLRAVLDLARSSPDLGLAVDPALVADAQVSGAHARAWASDLGTALSGRETFALPWSDPDLATVAHGNGADLLRTA